MSVETLLAPITVPHWRLTPERSIRVIAEAMRRDYEAIVAAELVLQIDAPDLGLGRRMLYRHLDEASFLREAAIHVEALNRGPRTVPGERAGMHVCWGSYEEPHHRDIP